MKKLFCYSSIAFLLSVTVVFSSCDKKAEKELPADPVPIVVTEKQQQVINSSNEFAFRIFSPLVQEAKGESNIIISPYSISSALSMALNGARNVTYDEMLKTLSLEGKTLEEINDTYLKLLTDMVPVDERVVMKIANSVWAEQDFPVKSEFASALEDYYKAEARSFDVTAPEASLNAINSWIEDKTNGIIKDMIKMMDPHTAMYLINAIYFNGKWKYQFDTDKTENRPFYLSSGAETSVPTMYNETNLASSHVDDVTLVELPYGQGNYTMVVAMPDEGVTCAATAALLDAGRWQQWMASLENNISEVYLYMPKFKNGYNRSLGDDLKALGMIQAFSNMADFSGISDDGVSITEVIHQAYIETNEEGTEAAAVTAIVFEVTSIDPSLKTIEINRPFIYFIREIYTGTIVFMGVVENPAAE